MSSHTINFYYGESEIGKKQLLRTECSLDRNVRINATKLTLYMKFKKKLNNELKYCMFNTSHLSFLLFLIYKTVEQRIVTKLFYVNGSRGKLSKL